MAFLAREYKVLSVFVLAVALLLVVGYKFQVQSLVALSFIIGALCSGLAGFFGMRVATNANVRTANAARQSLTGALAVAFNGGSVMGMSVVGLGVLGLSVLFIIYMSALPGEGLSLQERLSAGSVWELPPSRFSPAWAAESTPRPLMWEPTWWVRWKRVSPRMTPATPR